MITLAPGLANCDRILHLDLARFMEKPQETIKKCLTAVLDNNANYGSVAFPALGTGGLVLSSPHAAIFHRSSIVGMSSTPTPCTPKSSVLFLPIDRLFNVIPTHPPPLPSSPQPCYAFLCVCVCVCMRACMRVCVCVHVCVCVTKI